MIDLTVKTLDSQNHAFSLEDDQITVRGFKEHIAESVSVPADSQRLIYCGRVLQDDKKLNDYDVNGKVIHLVQRPPPQPGQRRNDNGQGQGQNHGVQVWQNPQRTHYRVTRTQMHGNAMYVGAMSVPPEIVEGHALPVPQLSNRLSNTRLHLAIRMLERANLLMGRLAVEIARDPNCPTNPPSTSEMNQPPIAPQVQAEQMETDLVNESRSINSTRLTEATAAVIAAALSAAGASNVTLFRAENGDNNAEAPVNDTNEDNQPQSAGTQQSQPSQSEQQGSASTSDSSTSGGQSRRRPRLQTPRPPLMAALLEQLMNAQDCLRPYIERYRTLMLEDRVLPRGGGPGSVEESQTIVNGVSKSLHYLSHACHALSDIIVDMGQEPPRNLRCRPIMIQQSTILQPGVPIQVEAHFSIHGQNSNNNNTNEESSQSANTAAPSESNETNFESNSQQPEPDASAQQQTEQQEQTQSPFVFNLPNDMVVMAVNPEGNMDTGSGSEQTQSGENNNNNNNNNNNGARISGATGADFIRNIMEAVTGHILQGGITTTTITTQNLPTGGQQTVSSLDGNTNAGQSTQARSNVGTHPTTATQTRSTSRQQAHPLNVGMSIGQMLEFDPFLPCNSHHVRPTPSTTSNTVTSMSQRPRTSQPSTSENQPQAQTATTSATTTSNANSTNTTSNTSTSSATASSSSSSTQNPLVNLLQQTLRGAMAGQSQPATFSSNSNNPDATTEDTAPEGEVFDLARNIFYVCRYPNSTAVVEESLNVGQRQGGRTRGIGTGDFSLYTIVFGSRSPRNEGNFFLDLTSLVLQNLTLDDFISLRRGTWSPISHQRIPVLEFLVDTFPYSSSEEIQEQAANELLSQIRPHLQTVFAGEEINSRNGFRIDIVATIASLLQRHIKHIVQLLLNNDIDNVTFGQETFNILQTLKKQLRAILRYSIRGGRIRFEAIITRFLSGGLQRSERILGSWWRDVFISKNQLTDAEIASLLVYETPSSQLSTVPSESSHQPSQAQSETEPMETEVVEERVSLETPAPDDGEEIPETFPNHELLPSDWVPIIARDGVRQRRQLQTQGMTNGGVTTFSDAYLGTLPTKRRKLIEQQKPRLLVSPTPNHSAISASMERLVREGVTRAGVEEVDGAAIGVAVDPGVRRAFGQAIRDCLNPRSYESPDFPDSTRFPNATKYFADQDRSPK
ncbi:uncharacterized protein LOC143353972 [Halictus rubicundus]|uniref:uncharacterized protein LOC143353972 n=1 Tax=Halictus rubicundus TaxID=77578 RepID=UPI004035F146